MVPHQGEERCDGTMGRNVQQDVAFSDPRPFMYRAIVFSWRFHLVGSLSFLSVVFMLGVVKFFSSLSAR